MKKSLYPEDSLLSESLNGYPKHPEKVDLPLEEFCEFYLRSQELNHLDDLDRRFLAFCDLYANSILLCREAYSNPSYRETDLFTSKKEDYVSKITFLRDYLKKTPAK
jgi:hypothetical protein